MKTEYEIIENQVIIPNYKEIRRECEKVFIEQTYKQMEKQIQDITDIIHQLKDGNKEMAMIGNKLVLLQWSLLDSRCYIKKALELYLHITED